MELPSLARLASWQPSCVCPGVHSQRSLRRAGDLVMRSGWARTIVIWSAVRQVANLSEGSCGCGRPGEQREDSDLVKDGSGSSAVSR